jgi:hypothetical protein
MPTDLIYLIRLQDYFATHGVLQSYARIGKLVGLRCIWGIVPSSVHSVR